MALKVVQYYKDKRFQWRLRYNPGNNSWEYRERSYVFKSGAIRAAKRLYPGATVEARYPS